MKFSTSFEINAERSRVVELFEDTTRYHEWQDGFVLSEQQEGNPKEKGSIVRMVYKMGKRGEMELIETTLDYDLPNSKYARYDHKHVSNTVHVKFESIADNKTKVTYDVDYVQFNSLFLKLVAKVNPSMFRKQTEKWLVQFKNMVEKT